MKTLSIIAILAIVATVFVTYSGSSYNSFELFLAEHKKNYNSVNEYEFRKAVFEENQQVIDMHNTEGHSFTLAMNKFGDLTLEEFKNMLGYTPSKKHVAPKNYGMQVAKSDETTDWEAEGKVSPIKNQGSCGSCWAFSAVGALEAAHAIAGNSDIQEFSEQQLVDCSKTRYNSGCNGGEMFSAFEWYQDHTACTEDDYPYHARDETCVDSGCSTSGTGAGNVASHNLFEKDDPSILHAEIKHAPHSLGISAGNDYFRFYSDGELDAEACPHSLDHGVLLVGYIAERDAWKVKNSWGTSWGESGYIYIKDNHKVSPGICGVNMEISRPILK